MLRKYLNRKNDQAISPVIGTILMIAATVIIAGAVYAAVNIYGGKSAKQTVDAAWKAQALDTTGNGVDDMIKVTYLNGPSNVDPALVLVSAKDAAGAAEANPSGHAGSWNPGDYVTYALTAAQKAAPPPATGDPVFITVAQSGTSMLDQTFTLKE